MLHRAPTLQKPMFSRRSACKIGLFCPADWDQFGKNAGPIRNKAMLAEHVPDVVIAFHVAIEKARGTKHMVTLARKAKIPVRVVSA